MINEETLCECETCESMMEDIGHKRPMCEQCQSRITPGKLKEWRGLAEKPIKETWEAHAFLMAARKAVPALINEVDRLTAELNEAKTELEWSRVRAKEASEQVAHAVIEACEGDYQQSYNHRNHAMTLLEGQRSTKLEEQLAGYKGALEQEREKIKNLTNAMKGLTKTGSAPHGWDQRNTRMLSLVGCHVFPEHEAEVHDAIDDDLRRFEYHLYDDGLIDSIVLGMNCLLSRLCKEGKLKGYFGDEPKHKPFEYSTSGGTVLRGDENGDVSVGAPGEDK